MRKGENIYRRKDGRWEGRYIRKRNENQRIIYGYVYGKKYQEVKEKLFFQRTKLAEEAPKNGEEREYTEWLLKDFLPRVEKKVKESTYSTYHRLISQHVQPFFAGKAFRELEKDIFQNFADELLIKGLKLTSIRLILSIVRQSLSDAVSQEYLVVSPLQDISLPKERQVNTQALSLTQQKELEKLAKESIYGLPILISLYSGLRIGEICGLTWDDIDFDQQIIKVTKTVSRVICKSNLKKTKVIVSSPKTNFSNRIVPIPAVLSAYLQQIRKTSQGNYLVYTKFGLAEPRIITYRFKKIIAQANFSDIHFHVLRHTFATRCLEKGMDIATLSRLMGHQSVKLTLDTYSDSTIIQKRKEIQKLNHLFEE